MRRIIVFLLIVSAVVLSATIAALIATYMPLVAP